MNCPACARSLSERRVGNISVWMCQNGCGGVWFDTFEVDQVDQDTEAVSELLFNTQRDQTLTVDASRPRNCPRCQGIQLKRVLLNPGSEVQIDECPSCDGCWLDERQLGRLHDERVEMIQSGRIQPGTSFNLLQYLFEVRTGRRR